MPPQTVKLPKKTNQPTSFREHFMNDKPRSSRLRLSLRTLMVIVLITGGAIGWKANRARDQRRAVAAIKEVNGNVVYDFQYTGEDLLTPKPFKPSTEPAAPKWLRNLVGDEYFQEVTMVNIGSPVSADILPALINLDHLVLLSINASKFDDSALAQLAKIPSLQSLSLTQGAVTDAGLAKLAGATKLRRLSLYGAAGVTNAGMANLAGLPKLQSVEIFNAPMLTFLGLKNLGPRLAELERLILYMTAITDEGMNCLDGCRKLKSLSLSSAKIGDAGFAHFHNMDSLETLVVSSTEVTDDGLASLRGLKNLKDVSVGHTKVSGSGLANLESSNLQSLFLMGANMDDSGLDQIRKLKGLRFLNVQGTKVSPEAIAALQAERPSLKISSGPATMPALAPARPVPPAKK